MPKQHICNLIAGRLHADGADIIGHHGHSVDHGGLLVLSDGIRAGFAHRQQALRAIVFTASQFPGIKEVRVLVTARERTPEVESLLRRIAAPATIAAYDERGEVLLPADARISFCFQEDRLLPWRTVLENVALACGSRDAAQAWLERVGLGAEGGSYPASLSGGMQRRAALARALAFDADILLMDEPFRALDEATHAQMRALVCEAAKDKLLILVTHDEADADGMTVVRI